MVRGPNTSEHRDLSSEEDVEKDESSKDLSEEEAKKEEEGPPSNSSSFKPMASHSRKSLLSTLTRHVH